MNKFRLLHRKKQDQKRLHNERVFIRAMIDCAIPKSKEEGGKVRLNQKGSDFSMYFLQLIHSFGAVCEPTLSVYCWWFWVPLIIFVIYRASCFLIRHLHSIFFFLKEFSFRFFHLSIVCPCMRKTNTKAHTQIHVHTVWCLKCRLSIILGSVIGGFVRQLIIDSSYLFHYHFHNLMKNFFCLPFLSLNELKFFCFYIEILFIFIVSDRNFSSIGHMWNRSNNNKQKIDRNGGRKNQLSPTHMCGNKSSRSKNQTCSRRCQCILFSFL